MAEINDFPSGTSSRPSQTLDRAAAFRNVFGEEPPPPPLPLARVSDVSLVYHV
ncbi:hypothetical protein TIFTF001_033673 [Ficus carica]|uniref:Uncharacterized protein n=1 Tax=Ficus carica TaxID=3494 RepID=A0AA88DZ74_FICCA|nr:hypothetical protein TIFTF001_033673 [Ficus carica]